MENGESPTPKINNLLSKVLELMSFIKGRATNEGISRTDKGGYYPLVHLDDVFLKC